MWFISFDALHNHAKFGYQKASFKLVLPESASSIDLLRVPRFLVYNPHVHIVKSLS